jgi:hypothetical protein
VPAGDLNLTRCPGILSYPDYSKVGSNHDRKFFQFAATGERRGSCDKRFLSGTLRRKVTGISGGLSRLVPKLPLGNARSRSSASYGACGVPSGSHTGLAKSKRSFEKARSQAGAWERGTKMAGSGAAAILAFFGVGPKKGLLVLLRQFALLPDVCPPHPRPLSRKARGVRELGWPAAMPDFIPPRPALRACLTFLGRSPKKSPLF